MDRDPLTAARVSTAALIAAVEASDRGKVDMLTGGPSGLQPVPSLSDPTPEANLREAQLLARTALGLPSSVSVPLPEGTHLTLRLGHTVRETGELVPTLAEHLASGRILAAEYPDHAVMLALGSGERARAASVLLRSPVRWLGRQPEAVGHFSEALLTVSDEPARPTWERWVDALPTERPSGTHDEVLKPRGLERNLPPDMALVSWLNSEQRQDEHYHSLMLESLALQHAANLAPSGEQNATLDTIWRLGHLIRAVVLESPFFGADSELLSARLAAVLAAHPNASPLAADPLWPTRLSKLDLGELRGIGMVASLDVGRELSAPVMSALEQLASRPVSKAELEAEHALFVRNGLSWAPRHVAPPLAARWLLHVRGAAWLARLSPAAQAETVALAEQFWPLSPARVRWILHGVDRHLRNGGALCDTERQRLVRLISGHLVNASGDDIPPLALVGCFLHGHDSSSLLPTLQSDEVWMSKAREAGPRWTIGLLRTFAERSARLRPAALGELAMFATSSTLGLPAATALVELARAGHLAGDMLQRIWKTVAESVRNDPGLIRDYKRVTHQIR